MEREGAHGRSRGFFVAFGYSRDAEQEILDEEHAQKM